MGVADIIVMGYFWHLCEPFKTQQYNCCISEQGFTKGPFAVSLRQLILLYHDSQLTKVYVCPWQVRCVNVRLFSFLITKLEA